MNARFSMLATALVAVATLAACSDDTNGSAGQDTANGLPIADGAGDAASADTTGSADTGGVDATQTDDAEADSAQADSAQADTSAADTAVADTAVADTTVADTTAEDTAAADTTVADTTAADTTVADTTVADTAVADTAADALGPFPGKVGACKQGAPGYDSCWVQAFVLCLQPGPTCASDLSFPNDGSTVFDTTWSNGSSMHCVTTTAGSDLTILCTGKGPDGKQCLQATYTSSGEMPGPATVTGPNGVQKSSYDSNFKRIITCSDGKIEAYNSAEDLCYPLQSGVCEVNTGGGG